MPFLPESGPGGPFSDRTALPAAPPGAAPAAAPAAQAPPASPAWQRDMQAAFRSLDPLLRHLDLRRDEAPDGLLPEPGAPSPDGADPADRFPILVTRSFADRMAKGDWSDPLLLQILPRAAEGRPAPGFGSDAVGDLPSRAAPGLLHKYASRVLLMISPHCAIHCRYCFRREFPYGDLPRGRDAWEAAWEYLEAAEGVDEIVLSGGDPLFLEDRRLARILSRALALPRIRTVRFHSRLPVVLPSRVDAGLLSLLSEAAAVKTVVAVVHANHPAEIAGDCPPALEALRGTGSLVLNQSVLLAGINDAPGVLAELSRRLLRHGVLPYYLHQLDRVSGAAHFEVDEARGIALVEEMRKTLPGYAVPRYVREAAGEPHKLPISA